MPQISHEDILVFVFQKGETRFSDLIEEFVESGKCAKQTLLNYKLALEANGKLEKIISRTTRRPVYIIPEKFRDEMKRLVAQRKISSHLATLDIKYIDPIRNMVIRMKHEGMELEATCFAFIGDVPTAFNKSVDGMRSHLALEKNLQERFDRALEKLWNEFEEANPGVPVSNWARDLAARQREEVGLTLGEYVKKLLKRVEKEKGIRKIMTFFGITEEMMEEMTREKEKRYTDIGLREEVRGTRK